MGFSIKMSAKKDLYANTGTQVLSFSYELFLRVNLPTTKDQPQFTLPLFHCWGHRSPTGAIL